LSEEISSALMHSDPISKPIKDFLLLKNAIPWFLTVDDFDDWDGVQNLLDHRFPVENNRLPLFFTFGSSEFHPAQL
jgi:hypothetical protein